MCSHIPYVVQFLFSDVVHIFPLNWFTTNFLQKSDRINYCFYLG